MRCLKKNQCMGIIAGLSICVFFYIVTVHLPEEYDDDEEVY